MSGTNQPSARPTNKVLAGTAASAITGILTWAAKEFGHVEIPGEIAIAISTLVGLAVAYVVRDASVTSELSETLNTEEQQ